MSYYRPGERVAKRFSLHHPTTGAMTNATGEVEVAVFRNESGDGGVVGTVTNIETGRYLCELTLPATYAPGDHVLVEVTATVGGVTNTETLLDTRLIDPARGLVLTASRVGPSLVAPASATVLGWDGVTLPFAGTRVRLSWPEPAGDPVSTTVLNLTTGDVSYFGPPTTTNDVGGLGYTDTEPYPGVTNTYRVTHQYEGSYVTRNTVALNVDGAATGRLFGVNIPFLGLRGNFTGNPASAIHVLGTPARTLVEDYYRTAVVLGARVVRTYSLSSVAIAGTLYPTLGGGFTESVAVECDYAVARAAVYGMRMVIPLTNEHELYNGGRKSFNHWGAGSEAAFYTDSTARNNFKAYLSLFINRVNTFTGVRYGDDPTILAWETGNEIDTAPPAWTAEMAAHIRSLAPGHLVHDGRELSGTNGSAYPDDAAVDIVTRHIYPRSNAVFNAVIVDDAIDVRPFGLNEWDWNAGIPGSANTLDELLDTVEAAGAAVDMSMPWAMGGHDSAGGWDPYDTNYGAFGIHWGDPALASNLLRVREHAATLHGEAVPDVTPLPPVVLAATETQVSWRGSAGSWTYTIQRSTAGPNSGYSTVASGLNAAQSPWTDPSPPTGDRWYRVLGVSQGGASGAPSVPAIVVGQTG